MNIKYKITIISVSILIIFFMFVFSSSHANSYENLSDYENHIVSGRAWLLIRDLSNNTIYLFIGGTSSQYFSTTPGSSFDTNLCSSMYTFISAYSEKWNESSSTYTVYKFNRNNSRFDYFESNYNNNKTYRFNSGYELIGVGNKPLYFGSCSSENIAFQNIAVPDKYIVYDLPTLTWSFDRRVNTIIMNSQNFILEDIEKYNLYYTTDSSAVSNYKNLPTASIGNIKKDEETSYFYFLSFDNYTTIDVTYYFILEEIETGRIATSTFKIKFGELNEYFDKELNDSLVNSGFGSNTSFTHGVPTLNMQYKRNKDGEDLYHYEIYSQYFSKTDVTDTYIAYYTNDVDKINDFSTWDYLSIATFKDTKTGQVNYYYFFTLPTDFTETTYYFVLYNKVTGQYGSPSSLKLKPEKMWEYSEVIDNDNNIVNSRFDNLINSLKNKFGFLFYPFELISDIFNRFLHINWEEPILTIPAINVPVFGNYVTDEFHYNFNDLLSTPIIKYIHSIYLIFADVIIIYCLLQLAIKTFEGVLNNG